MRNLFAFTVLLALGCGQSSTTPVSTETAVVTPAFNRQVLKTE